MSDPIAASMPKALVSRKALVAYAVAFGLWLPFAVIICFGGADLDDSLRRRFAGDVTQISFGDMSRALLPFCVIHSLATALAVMAISRRRFDIVVLLYAGPALAVLFLVPTERLDDLNWRIIGAVSFIGESVGILLTVILWALVPRETSVGQSPSSGTPTVQLPKSEIRNPK